VNNTQVCSTFGTNPMLDFLRDLWVDGDASFFANIGSLIAPTTQEQYRYNTVPLPPGLKGHDTQQRQSQSVHSANEGAKGVLGRMAATLTTQPEPYRTHVYSMYGTKKLVQGPLVPVIMEQSGVQRFAQYGKFSAELGGFTDRESSSFFADTYASILESSLARTEQLSDTLAEVNLAGSYSGSIGFENIARVVSVREQLQSERDVFMVGLRTFDSHQSLNGRTEGLLNRVDADMEAFHTDMVALGLWDNVTIVSISDFGRTLSSNGRGTDHAWGGNMFIAGGSVRGRRIHGYYPTDLVSETSELEVGRGRGVLIPTTPWEGMWYGVTQWMDVHQNRVLDVVPGAVNFEVGTTLFTKTQLYDSEE
jgi:uncharacterized protein (DUF1501 family)